MGKLRLICIGYSRESAHAWPGLAQSRERDTADGGSEAPGDRALPELPQEGACQADVLI